jgi:hypothetical protein
MSVSSQCSTLDPIHLVLVKPHKLIFPEIMIPLLVVIPGRASPNVKFRAVGIITVCNIKALVTKDGDLVVIPIERPRLCSGAGACLNSYDRSISILGCCQTFPCTVTASLFCLTVDSRSSGLKLTSVVIRVDVERVQLTRDQRRVVSTGMLNIAPDREI